MSTGIRIMPQPPEHDHLKMLADWYGWIIFALVTIIIAIAKAVGKLSNTEIAPVYALRDDMVDCQKKLMEEFKGMRQDVNTKIDENHKELHNDLIRAHQRIDVLYRRDT